MVLHSKCRSTEGWLSHFFEIASTGIAEVTWRRAPIHTKIGRFSCWDFYSCNCPSLGIAAAAEQKYSTPGHWDVGEKSHQEQQEPSKHRSRSTAAEFCQSRARIPEHWSCALLRQIPVPISVYGTHKKTSLVPLRSGMDLLMQHHQPWNSQSSALGVKGEPPGNSGNADWAYELPQGFEMKTSNFTSAKPRAPHECQWVTAPNL